MGYVTDVERPTRRAALVRRGPSGLGLAPLAVAGALASKVPTIFRGNTNSQQDQEVRNIVAEFPPETARAILISWRDAVLDPRWPVGSQSPITRTALEGRVNNGTTGRPTHQRDIIRSQSLPNLEREIAARAGSTPISAVAPRPVLQVLPGTATVATPAGPQPILTTIGTRAPARPRTTLQARTPSGAAPATTAPSALDSILRAVAQLAPGTAPVISQISPTALPTPAPVTVSVTAPAASGGAGGFLSQYGLPIALGVGGLVAVRLLMKGRR